MIETVECEVCGRELRAGPGAASHMRAMHPETLATPSTNGHSAPDHDGIVWEEPPTKGRGIEARLVPIIPTLRAHPGQWARVAEFDGRTTATAYASKARRAYPDCEFRPGPHGEGSALWARLTPTEEAG